MLHHSDGHKGSHSQIIIRSGTKMLQKHKMEFNTRGLEAVKDCIWVPMIFYINNYII